MKNLPNILVIDANKKDTSLMQECLADAGVCCIFHTFQDIKDTAKCVRDVQFDLAIVELGSMKGEDFIANEGIFDALSKLCDQVESVVVCTDSASMEHVHQTFQAGAFFFYKPILRNDWQEFVKMVASHVTVEPKKVEKEVPIIRYDQHDRPIDPGSNGFKPTQKKTGAGRC